MPKSTLISIYIGLKNFCKNDSGTKSNIFAGMGLVIQNNIGGKYVSTYS
jgi:hypothetical protein